MASRRPRPRRTWPQRLLIAIGLVASAAFGAAVYVLNIAQDKASEVQRIAIGGDVLAPEVSTAEARNILVVGIDSAAGLDPDDPRAIDRPDSVLTDTIMIVRLDPAAETASILSIPRDLAVSIGGSDQKINQAVGMGGGLEGGGVPLLIETIETNFGIPVNNFVQVDFAAFIGIVDAIDGVPFYFPTDIRDRKVGLRINSGCNVVDSSDALDYVRSRTIEELVDGVWVDDQVAPDLKRIGRQQSFVVAMVERAIAKGARNPITLNGLIDAAIADVVLDTRLTPGDLLDLGGQFREFRADNLQTFTFDGLFDIDLHGAAALAMNDTPHNQAVKAVFGGRPPAEAETVTGTGEADGTESQAASADESTDPAGGLGDIVAPPAEAAALSDEAAALPGPDAEPTPEVPTCR